MGTELKERTKTFCAADNKIVLSLAQTWSSPGSRNDELIAIFVTVVKRVKLRGRLRRR